VPVNLIGLLETLNPLGEHHDLLTANLDAQAEALAFGKTADEVGAEGTREHLMSQRVLDRNRPSNVMLARRLTPEALGRLVAQYAHNVLTQGIIWGLDSFDQWEVELGKVLASRVATELRAEQPPALAHDSSTNALIGRYRPARRGADE